LNRSSFAFFVALLIHLLVFLLLWILWTMTPSLQHKKQHQEKRIKISLKEMPKKHKKSGMTKKKVKPSPVAPPMPKGSQLKKIVQQKPIKYEPKKPVRKPHLNKPKKSKKIIKKISKKIRVKPLPTKKMYIPLRKKEYKKKQTKNPLSWLEEDKSSQELKQKKKKTAFNSGNISQNIKKLYGDTFGKLSPGQQKYILDNQEIMRRITQQVLNRVARVNIPRDLNVNRTNVIEFKLHPNGDMSDFRFISKSGYYILDDTTKETIEYAYSRYPRPKETTLIRYNVYYNLARY